VPSNAANVSFVSFAKVEVKFFVSGIDKIKITKKNHK
jgi:hypothetical protein